MYNTDPNPKQGALSSCCGVHAQAEARSRAEVYEAQVAKMQRALERADQENSRLEQALIQVCACRPLTMLSAALRAHIE